MEKTRIEGLNGFLEINKKYVYLVLKNNEKDEEHIVWFYEIENIAYKRPTKNKKGFISLYVSVSGFVLSKKKVYTLILDKIDEKSINEINKLYGAVKTIINVKDIPVLEVLENVDNIVEEKISETREVGIVEKKQDEKKSIAEETPIIIPKEEVTRVEEVKPVFIPQEEKEPIQEKNIIKESVKEDNCSLVVIRPEIIEEKVESILDEEERKEELEEQEKEEKQLKTLDNLEKKAEELEKELEALTYKEKILNEKHENELERKKIDKLIIELKKIIEKINKIKKEILKQEKTISSDNYISLNNGNVTVLDISKTSYDEKSLNDYIDKYKDVVRELDNIQNSTESLSESLNQKKKDLGISDEEYEEKINQFKGVKDNKEFISKLLRETKEDLSRVKRRIESTVETHVKYKFVRRSISDQTKKIAALTALNSIRPNHSKVSMVALSIFAGVSAITDLFRFDIKEEKYNELVQKEILEGLEYVDTDKARAMIESSREQINSVIEDIEKKYGDYPKFGSLKKSLISLRNEIDSQDKELKSIEDKLKDYYAEPKVKTLRHTIEE